MLQKKEKGSLPYTPAHWAASGTHCLRCTFPGLGSGLGCIGCSGQLCSELWPLQSPLRPVANRDWVTRLRWGVPQVLAHVTYSHNYLSSGSSFPRVEPPSSCVGPALPVHPSWTLAFCGDITWILPLPLGSRFTCLLLRDLKAAQSWIKIRNLMLTPISGQTSQSTAWCLNFLIGKTRG